MRRRNIAPSLLSFQLLAQACRVLQSGGVFVGSDSTSSLMWNIYHLFDARVPVDTDTF